MFKFFFCLIKFEIIFNLEFSWAHPRGTGQTSYKFIKVSQTDIFLKIPIYLYNISQLFTVQF